MTLGVTSTTRRDLLVFKGARLPFRSSYPAPPDVPVPPPTRGAGILYGPVSRPKARAQRCSTSVLISPIHPRVTQSACATYLCHSSGTACDRLAFEVVVPGEIRARDRGFWFCGVWCSSRRGGSPGAW